MIIEEEVDKILNVPHQPIRAQPARATKQGITYSTLNVEQYTVHDDCDPGLVGKYIHAINHSFIQTYSLKAGLRKFKDRGMAAALKQMKQQHKWACFVPINYDNLTKTERGKMMEMVNHMLVKWDKTIKFRNGKWKHAAQLDGQGRHLESHCLHWIYIHHLSHWPLWAP